MSDYPHVREMTTCPTCNRPKDTGLIVCWTCYRSLDIRNGLPNSIKTILDNTEAAHA